MFGADYAPDCVACLEGVENGVVAYGSVCSGDLVGCYYDEGREDVGWMRTATRPRFEEEDIVSIIFKSV